MVARWWLQLQASCPYATTVKRRSGEGMATGSSADFCREAEVLPEAPKQPSPELGDVAASAAREDGKDSIGRGAGGSPCRFRSIMIYPSEPVEEPSVPELQGSRPLLE